MFLRTTQGTSSNSIFSNPSLLQMLHLWFLQQSQWHNSTFVCLDYVECDRIMRDTFLTWLELLDSHSLVFFIVTHCPFASHSWYTMPCWTTHTDTIVHMRFTVKFRHYRQLSFSVGFFKLLCINTTVTQWLSTNSHVLPLWCHGRYHGQDTLTVVLGSPSGQHA